MIGDSEQYMQLIQIYGEMGDDELLALAGSKDDLTETAQEVLRVEMGKRRLMFRQADTAESTTVAECGDVRAFAERAPDDCVWEFAENEDALAAGEWLQSEGVPCEVVLPRAEKFDLKAPRLVVMPKDVERASAILSRPYRRSSEPSSRLKTTLCCRNAGSAALMIPYSNRLILQTGGSARAVGTNGWRRYRVERRCEWNPPSDDEAVEKVGHPGNDRMLV